MTTCSVGDTNGRNVIGTQQQHNLSPVLYNKTPSHEGFTMTNPQKSKIFTVHLTAFFDKKLVHFNKLLKRFIYLFGYSNSV